MKHVTPDKGTAFQSVYDAMQEAFLAALFKMATSQIPRRLVTGLPFKQYGISLPESTQTAGVNWTASCIITGHIVAALRRTAEFRSGDHSLLIV